MAVTILLVVFVFGLTVGIPVAITLGLSSLAYLAYVGIPIVVMPQKMYAGMDVFVLLCIPGFILAGNLMNRGGITQRIIRFANALVGWIRGGLGLTNIAGDLEGRWVDLAWEAVVAADPDVIVLIEADWSSAAEKREYMEADPVLSELSAVQAGRFVTIPLSQTVLGMQFADGLDNLSAQLDALN